MNSVDSQGRSKRMRPSAGQGSPHPTSARRRKHRLRLLAGAALLFVLGMTAGATSVWWWPPLLHTIGAGPGDEAEHAATAHGPEGEDAHEHAGSAGSEENAPTSIELSEQGRKNIGLTLKTVDLEDFAKTVSIPAEVVERPGLSRLTVAAPMTGTVTRIHIIRGEAVVPGAPLFDLRLTHEDLVEKQSSLLRLLEELDVVKQEVARLEDVTASGAVAGKRLLEQQYEQRKIEAAVRAERQALVLHGLTKEQVQGIVDERELLQTLTIPAPELGEHAAGEEHAEFLQVAEINVSVGEHVQTGIPLATLTDHCELYIEGKAFEQDAEALNRAANEEAEVTAIIEGNGSGDRRVDGLQILHVENQVERESRALNFYVLLPNRLVRNEVTQRGHRFIGWRYRSGQRVDVRVPVERWERQIVLPADAVVEEGAERYVYQELGGRFVRRPVHVMHRDRHAAVIEADGSLFPGDRIAARGAYQIHLALKNKAGGGPDPHAGHSH